MEPVFVSSKFGGFRDDKILLGIFVTVYGFFLFRVSFLIFFGFIITMIFFFITIPPLMNETYVCLKWFPSLSPLLNQRYIKLKHIFSSPLTSIKIYLFLFNQKYPYACRGGGCGVFFFLLTSIDDLVLHLAHLWNKLSLRTLFLIFIVILAPNQV